MILKEQIVQSVLIKYVFILLFSIIFKYNTYNNFPRLYIRVYLNELNL